MKRSSGYSVKAVLVGAKGDGSKVMSLEGAWDRREQYEIKSTDTYWT